EEQIYEKWLAANAFHAERDPDKKPYCIVIPPPNITGQLHMGHALDETLQDIIIRHKRMQGYAALWLPGCDHASIATEARIVKAMAADGVSKADIGREGFLERAWAWKEKYGGTIMRQLRRLGSSCDWERERFTMDKGCCKAVTEVFVSLYEKGLLYRGDRIINWCCGCKTALSDAEVDYVPEDGHLWHITYPLTEGKGGITVATTRPETMLGDTAVAVHPSDERYIDLIGKTVRLPLTGREIPIIADEYVEKDFGSGAVKITPAHDPNDFEVGLRHNLPAPCIMDEGGIMTIEAGERYAGLERSACREMVLRDLAAGEFLSKTEDYEHNVNHCSRCHGVLEPRLSLQWFVKMKPLAQPAIEAVKSGEIKFTPDRFGRTYLTWMENIRDWCVSRQLWWGHRIPAWYCPCGETIVSRETPLACTNCGGNKITQDEDVLDTWFSSALWPFSTLGWPEKTEDLQYFYPTSTLVTSYDIIPLWVARMIFSGLEHMGQKPFSDVLIHGLVRDEQGRKMSKSLDNGIDPLEVIAEFGADALRFSLVAGNAPGNDMRFQPARVEGARNFCNKLHNAVRFVLGSAEGIENISSFDHADLTLPQRWILHKFAETTAAVTENLEKFDLGAALSAVYDFLWDDFCDWAIELAKPVLYGEDAAAKAGQAAVLLEVLRGTLALLHPFMPFITEDLYGNLPGSSTEEGRGFLMLSAWPDSAKLPRFEKEAADMERVIQLVRSVRNLRAELKVAPSKQAPAVIVASPEARAGLENGIPFALRLCGFSSVDFADDVDRKGMAVAVSEAGQVFLPLSELVDVEAERLRLQKEIDKNAAETTKLEARLSNPAFVERANPAVVEKEREKQAALAEMRGAL
ncbi:MAG: valine--tRNA ligase, partial [Clostridia bacterium]|nr:valine--tRNA ligase [Clostridia bacterium]